MRLLEDDDPSVYIAAGQGLALIFESRNLDKFCSREKSYGESSTLKMYSCVEETIKGVVLEKLEHLGRKQISETVVDKVKKQYLHILEYFQVLFAFLFYFFYMTLMYSMVDYFHLLIEWLLLKNC